MIIVDDIKVAQPANNQPINISMDGENFVMEAKKFKEMITEYMRKHSINTLEEYVKEKYERNTV